MSNPAVVLYVLAMVGVVVAVDLLLFRDKTWFWERLAANVGIVLVFGAFYFRFPWQLMIDAAPYLPIGTRASTTRDLRKPVGIR